MTDGAALGVDLIDEWDAALRAYAAVVDEHRCMLVTLRANGAALERTVVPPAFVPPAGLGPLPEQLLPRARALAAETTGLVEFATELSSELRASMSATSTGLPVVRTIAGAAGGASMDQRM